MGIVRDCVHVLMGATPLDLTDEIVMRIVDEIYKIPGVAKDDGVHDLHIWGISMGVYAVSMHIRSGVNDQEDKILTQAQKICVKYMPRCHMTIQVEHDAGYKAHGEFDHNLSFPIVRGASSPRLSE